ncbi:adenosine deaminase family protein [Hydrogenophaga sp. BPS33]|uniref:adenosine deaminase family protein n=1 Tax=Hydrogenophaga sp. BPS33 TaxID=2651974 RepID=UPI0019175B14|nr:adenosine deaminase [Hydrogenophaga sp. BPS33]
MTSSEHPGAPTLLSFLRAMPKMELHCHLFGTVRRETFAALNREAGLPLSEEEVIGFYTRGEKPVGVLRVLRALDAQLVRSAHDLYRLTTEYLEDAAAHNVRYSEFFWNPTGTVQVSGIPYAAAQDAIVQAIRDAERPCGIVGRLIAAVDREASPQAATEMVQWVCENRCDEVIGIGIDYRENDRPPELFARAYQDARRAGLKTTAHAGEFGMPWTHVRTALDLLQVDRIDHGYTVVDNPAFAQECAERGVLFTVVPTNSYYLRTLPPERWALDHPIRRMPGQGLRIHPNTDDPTLHHVTPTGAWHMMVRDFGYGLDDLRSFMHNGLDGAWIDDTQRRRWHAEWSTAFNVLRGAMSKPSAFSSPLQPS